MAVPVTRLTQSQEDTQVGVEGDARESRSLSLLPWTSYWDPVVYKNQDRSPTQPRVSPHGVWLPLALPPTPPPHGANSIRVSAHGEGRLQPKVSNRAQTQHKDPGLQAGMQGHPGCILCGLQGERPSLPLWPWLSLFSEFPSSRSFPILLPAEF
jgi:hypothetical protein